MARIRNEEDYIKKKHQIVMHAVDLLEALGYEEFSVNKVIKAAGMTKGAFFHYFESKNDLLKAIMDLILIPMIDAFNQVSEDLSLQPKMRMKLLFEVGRKVKGLDQRMTQQLIRLLQKVENKSILTMVTTDIVEQLVPLYEAIINEGNDKGDFDIPYPNGTAFIFLHMITAINKELGSGMFEEHIDQQFYVNLIDKINAFELYAKEIFQFEEEVNFYKEELLMINQRH